MLHRKNRARGASSRFRLLFRIASGGMGTVYVAEQRGAAGFRRLVAVKRAHPHLLEDPALARMVVMEAHLSSLIRHPNVVSVTDVEESDGELLLVMDYVEGGSLAALNREQTPLDLPVAVRIILDACDGLEALHRARDDDGNELGLVHRDVSPDNILVGIDGVSRIADLGIARACAREGSVSLVRGKPSYMAPEYLSTGRATPASDVFALGVVAWETFCGRRLCAPGNDLESARQLLTASHPPPSEVARRLPKALDPIVLRALSPDPGRRFTSAATFGTAIAAALCESTMKASGIAPRHEVGGIVRRVFGPKLHTRREALKQCTPTAAIGAKGSGLHNRSVELEHTAERTAEEIHPAPLASPRARITRTLRKAGSAVLVTAGLTAAMSVYAGGRSSPSTPAPPFSSRTMGGSDPSYLEMRTESVPSTETAPTVAPVAPTTTETTISPTPRAHPEPRPSRSSMARAKGHAAATSPSHTTNLDVEPAMATNQVAQAAGAGELRPSPERPDEILATPAAAPDNPYEP